MAPAVCYRSFSTKDDAFDRRTSLSSLFPPLLAAGLWRPPEKITPELERWLEDVGPILTKTERAVFNRLQTNADRAKFVRFFWRTRDPLPDTAENEFQKEYEERVRYADENFGRFSPKRGSQTDRGFFHVVLGKPLERTTFATQSQVWPLELWFYKGDEAFGLPSYFYLIFYQPDGIGDYRLYSPSVEGPEKLAVPTLGSGVAVTRSTAVTAIQGVSAGAGQRLPELPAERFARRGRPRSHPTPSSLRSATCRKRNSPTPTPAPTWPSRITSRRNIRIATSRASSGQGLPGGRPAVPPLVDRAREDELRHARRTRSTPASSSS